MCVEVLSWHALSCPDTRVLVLACCCVTGNPGRRLGAEDGVGAHATEDKEDQKLCVLSGMAAAMDVHVCVMCVCCVSEPRRSADHGL